MAGDGNDDNSDSLVHLIPTNKKARATKLRLLGFCGADDSVHPHLLGLISQAYPFVEFGILFRPDKEGTPRYASRAWVNRLSVVATARMMQPQQQQHNSKFCLAAHLCASRVNEVLDGNDDFVSSLKGLGFQRVQINATAVNGVDTSQLGKSVEPLLQLINKHVELEFIIQQNEETRPLWENILAKTSAMDGSLPLNMTMLVDESKGTGTLATRWPSPPQEFDIGYAGGIGPDNIIQVLEQVSDAAKGRDIWIDMESSLRSIKNDKDVFDLDKCYAVIDAVCQAGFHRHPKYLPS